MFYSIRLFIHFGFYYMFKDKFAITKIPKSFYISPVLCVCSSTLFDCTATDESVKRVKSSNKNQN